MTNFNWKTRMIEQNDSDWSDGMKEIITGYHSPIELIVKDCETEMENYTMRVIQQYGINVDKEELIKALNYDRGQYEKGMEDAKRVFQPMCRHFGKCMSHPEVSREYYDYCYLYREDCKCQCLWRQEEE